jgi:hypothetical protein
MRGFLLARYTITRFDKYCFIFHTEPSLKSVMITSIMPILYKSCFSKQLVIFLFLLNCVVLAQDKTQQDTKPGEPVPLEKEDLAGAATTPEAASEANQGRYLVVNELGFGVGYPTYQLYHVYYSFQRDQFGVAFKGSYTASDGIFIGVAGRYYTPIPVPVPTFVSLGVGIAGGSAEVSATFGAHIPFGLTSSWRATLEGGVAYVGGQGIRPVVSLGVGYVFYVDAAPLSEAEIKRRELLALGSCSEAQLTTPNPDTVDEAFDIAVQDWIDGNRAQYAGVYTNLRYSKEIDSIEFSETGDEATVNANFSGSIEAVGSGSELSASGTIEARFGWTGCSWRTLGYEADVN